MRILLIGANGQLGTDLRPALTHHTILDAVQPGTPKTSDAAIVFSAQAVEHYEITRYGSLVAFAKALGMKDAETELKRVLDQEYAADKALSGMAETGINRAAA